MRVLGIDCGSEVTGFAVVEGDGRVCRPIEWGAIRVPARAPLANRLLKIGEELRLVIERHQPEIAAIEGIFFAVNVKSALRLGHVRGVAMLEAARAGLPVAEYSALQVKASVVGYGRAEKRQVQQMVKVILGLPEPPQSEDAADALAIAICHINTAATELKIAAAAAAEAGR